MRTGATSAAKAANRQEEALLGAKMVGRWQSGAPLALSPDQDDANLGSDPRRNNDFLFADDPRGFKCPVGAHLRRANPRDALDQDGSVDVRLHRMIRRGTSYGPMLGEGLTEDDGIDRGIVFVFAGAHIKRQFEFVKTQWLNDGIFIGAPRESDPLVGPHVGSSGFTIPDRPIRRKLQNLPPFVVTRGGEYCFAPSFRARCVGSENSTRDDVGRPDGYGIYSDSPGQPGTRTVAPAESPDTICVRLVPTAPTRTSWLTLRPPTSW